MLCCIRDIGLVVVGVIIGVAVIVIYDHSQDNKPVQEVSRQYRSCRDVPMKLAVFNFRVNDKLNAFDAYCEQEEHGGGWMIIQYRFNGELSFKRDWALYRNGFNDANGEQWLGLEKIYYLTNEFDCELLIEMKDFKEHVRHARYSSFKIGSEAEQYSLISLGEYSGTAGDSLTFHKGMMFSTPDRDNDADNDLNCADDYNGGWWFKNCAKAFLNGPYEDDDGRDAENIMWYDFGNDYRGLSYTRMMIRPVASD